jgi:hypothetical protein
VRPRNLAARVVDSAPFTTVVVATIAVNAVVLGLQTYDGLVDRWGDALDLINAQCLGIFVVELVIRIASYWLNAMEEAREFERRRALRERHGVAGPSPVDPEAHAHVAERIVILRRALEDMELQLALGSDAPDRSRSRDG